jgi:hypothetical protein
MPLCRPASVSRPPATDVAITHHSNATTTAAPATVRPTDRTRWVRLRSRAAASITVATAARPISRTAIGAPPARPYASASASAWSLRSSSAAGRISVAISRDALSR